MSTIKIIYSIVKIIFFLNLANSIVFITIVRLKLLKIVLIIISRVSIKL